MSIHFKKWWCPGKMFKHAKVTEEISKVTCLWCGMNLSNADFPGWYNEGDGK